MCVQQGRPIFDIEFDEPKFEEGGFSLVGIPVTDPAGVGIPDTDPVGGGMPGILPGVGIPDILPGVGMPERPGTLGIFDVAGSTASVAAGVSAGTTVAASAAAASVVSLMLHFLFLNNFLFTTHAY